MKLAALFCSLALLATANIDMGDSTVDYGGYFGKIIRKASIRLQTIAEKRPLKIKAWNDSISHTAKAALGMASKQPIAEVRAELEAARSVYPENNFAFLLEAILINAEGNPVEANQLFETFLLQSRTFTEFEETFLHWAEFHMLRRSVYELLRSRGISFKGREKDIQIRIPYEAFFRYVLNPKREDWMLNLVFVVMILGGTVLLVLASHLGVDFSAPSSGMLIVIYIIVWIAYGLWIFDLAFGLPFGWPRTVIVPVFLGVTIFGLLGFEGFLYWREKNRPLQEGYKKCPHCEAVIVILAIECSECRKKL